MKITQLLTFSLSGAAALTALLLPGTVQAQTTGQVNSNLTVRIPPFLVLYYSSDITVDLTGNAAGLVGGGGAASLDVGATTVTGFNGPVVDTASIPGTDPIASLNSVDVVLEEFWAVRALGQGTGNNVQVDVAIGDATLDNSASGGTGTITINSVSPNQTLFVAPNPSQFTTEDITVNLDLTNADQSGDYTTGIITIEAQLL